MTPELTRPKYPVGLAVLAVTIVCLSFLLFLNRPQFLVDTGFHAYSALQYVHGEVGALHSVRFANPRDLSQDAVTNLVNWPPVWTVLFAMAFKVGMSVGAAAKTIEFLLSVTGALGWVWVTSLLRLRSHWRTAAVILASLYCMRSGNIVNSTSDDAIVYAVAPWIIGAAVILSRRKATTDNLATAALCVALGCVYWLKYSGIFFSAAVFCALIIEHIRRNHRRRLLAALGVTALFGAAFALPVVAEKAYNYFRSGSDLIEAKISGGVPPRRGDHIRGLIEETVYETGTLLFGTLEGADRMTQNRPPVLRGMRMDYRPIHWLVRVPGLLLLALFFYSVAKWPEQFVRNVAILLVAVPVVGILALSIASGLRFTSALVRCSEPSCIFVELLILKVLSQKRGDEWSIPGTAKAGLAIVVCTELLLLGFVPLEAVKQSIAFAGMPKYKSSAALIRVPNFSATDSRDVTSSVLGVLRDPLDVIAPATRNLGMDTWLELQGHRLLPLTNFFLPIVQGQGREGASYFGKTPFLTSHALRVVLVACDSYHDAGFQASVALIKSRFTQAKEWTHQPAPADSKVEIWTADLTP